MTSPLKIGELARESGASVRMLRFYEQLGLLAPVRNAAGYRLYDAADVALARKVRLLNQAGLPLKTLALMRDCLRDEPQDFCAELRRAQRDAKYGNEAERAAAIEFLRRYKAEQEAAKEAR